MTATKNRIDPSDLSPEDMEGVEQFLQSLDRRPALESANGTRIEMPEPVYQMMLQVLRTLHAGKAMFLVPDDEAFTTQAAANYLGVSRPFLIKLLDEGQIPHHLVGSHRRIYFRDLIRYDKARNSRVKQTLNELASYVASEGLEDDDTNE